MATAPQVPPAHRRRLLIKFPWAIVAVLTIWITVLESERVRDQRHTLRAYPVCQYNGHADAQLSSLNSKVKDMLSADPHARIFATADSKWLMIYAENRWHAKTLNLWPAFGCIGNYSSDVTHSKYAACLLTLKEVLKRDDVTITGDRTDSMAKNEVLFCQGT